jgi:hypothetical protein
MKRVVSSMFATTAWVLVFSGAALAHDFVLGATSAANVTIGSDQNWQVIRSVVLPLGDPFHTCAATASADMERAATGANSYRFVLSADANPITNTGSERTLSLINNAAPVNDPDSKPVSTTQWWVFSNVASRTIYFLGRKFDASDADADILDASLTVVCTDWE